MYIHNSSSKPSADMGPEPEFAAAEARRDRVLVVDDEALVGEVATTVLRENGYHAEYVLSGEEAVARLRADSDFILILMDIRMGSEHMNGGTAAEQIWEDYTIPSLFYTGYSDEGTLRLTDGVLAYGYVRKTGRDFAVLLRAVRAAIEHHRRHVRLSNDIRRTTDLVKEAHHRVKNNLAVLGSLVELRRHELARECRCFADMVAAHLGAAERLHALLQEKEENTPLELGAYLRQVLETVLEPALGLEVDIRVEGDTVEIAAKKAMPVGMIVSEVASNAAKYAFLQRAGTKNTFRVQLRADPENGYVEVSMRHSGPPIPPEADLEGASLGMHLVHAFTRQLRGELEIHRSPEPCFVLRIPTAA
ncbi:MAG: sensor histidine kinase [Spirochaetota bacterium]